jgi:hypothetical protein
MLIVVAGARADLGEFDAALHALDSIDAPSAAMAARVAEAKQVIAMAKGGPDGPNPEAVDMVEDSATHDDRLDEEVFVYDLEDDIDD